MIRETEIEPYIQDTTPVLNKLTAEDSLQPSFPKRHYEIGPVNQNLKTELVE